MKISIDHFFSRALSLRLSAYVLLVVLWLTACRHEEVKVTEQHTSTAVSPAEARLAAQHIYRSPVVVNWQAGRVQTKQVAGMTVVNRNGVPALYIFNYHDGGFVVIAADRKVAPVLAYSDEGSFGDGVKPEGLEQWMESSKEMVSAMHSSIKGAETNVLLQWEQLLCPFDTNMCGELRQPQTVSVGPLLATRWGQECGYNEFCPFSTSANTCYRMYAGCAATAIAQVINYWQYPTFYKWNEMQPYTSSFQTARLIRDAGTAVNMQYTEQGGIAYMEDIDDAFRNFFGYRSAQVVNYNEALLKAELIQRRPVILSGSVNSAPRSNGHAWVCDGYQETTYPDGYTALWMHMNWGWNEENSKSDYVGWYAYNNWEVPDPLRSNFRYNRRMIVEIKPW